MCCKILEVEGDVAPTHTFLSWQLHIFYAPREGSHPNEPKNFATQGTKSIHESRI